MNKIKITKCQITGIISPLLLFEVNTNEVNPIITVVIDNIIYKPLIIKRYNNIISYGIEIDSKVRYLEIKYNNKTILKKKNRLIERIGLKVYEVYKQKTTTCICNENNKIGLQDVTIKQEAVLKMSVCFTKKNNNDSEIIIRQDGITTNYNIEKLNNHSYLLTTPVFVDIKKVEMFVKCGDKEELIFTKKNIKYRKPKLKKKHYFNKMLYPTVLVGIEELEITGLINPLLTIKGSTKYKNQKFIIKEGHTKLNFTKKKLSGVNSFIIECELKKIRSKLEIFIHNGSEEQLIIKIKNTLLRRVLHVIKKPFKSFFNKLRVSLIVIIRGIKFLWREHKFLVPISLWKKYILHYFNRIEHYEDTHYNPLVKKDYLKWLGEQEELEEYESFSYNPLISIIIPVYNIEKKYLKECLDSILNQTYKNFEICLADDASNKEETLKTLKYYEKKYNCVKVIYRESNGHISACSNSALSLASGEFCVLVDNDDVISKDALYEVVKALNKDKELDFIYSDEDKIDYDGQYCEPHFKPDYSPDTLLSSNYICHLSAIRTSLIKKVGCFELGVEGAQDYDLFLKVVEQTNNIHHIPKVLYHWRKIEGSTSSKIDNKSYAVDKGIKVIENALKRRGIKGRVLKDEMTPYYKIKYDISSNPLISILIPTRDYANILEDCLKSIYKLTTYNNFEVIVLNNQSREPETNRLFKKYKKEQSNFRVIDIDTEFNYSNINNIGVSEANGDYIVLLNNDTTIITKDWLEIMVGYAKQAHIGTVGVELLYPDLTIQHAGVIMGLGGVASHAYIGHGRYETGLYGRLRCPYNYSCSTAACLMISKEKFLSVGGLEEKLKVAYNDVDLNLKLLEEGYYNVFLPQVQVMHYESKSRGLDKTGEKYKRFLREEEFMYKKWKIKETNDPYYNINFSKTAWFSLDKK